jgi:hypothetical protein
MRHRIVWPVVATLALGSLILVISQSTAQWGAGGFGGNLPGTPGTPGMPGTQLRFIVANASSSQVLILDTATGLVYRAKEDDFKKLSDLPHLGGGRGVQPPARDRRPESRDKVKSPAPARDRRTPEKDAPKDEAPARREEK